jgi:hypothetical protein
MIPDDTDQNFLNQSYDEDNQNDFVNENDDD